MLKNIYTPLAGALAQQQNLDVIANNLANVNTVGYKGDSVTFTLQDAEPFKSYNEPLPPANFKHDISSMYPLHGNDMSYVGAAGMTKDFTQGPAINTGNKLDLMIEGEGMFAVNSDEGTRYMRSGDLTLNRDGALVSKNGDPVLGEKGTIYIRGNDFEINRNGEVIQDGNLIDRIPVYEFKDASTLERAGNNYFTYSGAPEDVSVSKKSLISQGFLEGSNVNAVKSLSSMILAHRSYEAYQKAVKNFDSMMEKSSNVIGEVRA